MPLYDYRCPVCGTRYELLRRIRQMDDPATCTQGHVGGVRVEVNRIFRPAPPGAYEEWRELAKESQGSGEDYAAL